MNANAARQGPATPLIGGDRAGQVRALPTGFLAEVLAAGAGSRIARPADADVTVTHAAGHAIGPDGYG